MELPTVALNNFRQTKAVIPVDTRFTRIHICMSSCILCHKPLIISS